LKTLDLQEKKIERILLIRLRNIGDVLLMVPTIRAFRGAFPKAHIAALVNAGTEEMLTDNPLLDEVLVFDPKWKELSCGAHWQREWAFASLVRKRRFDLAINLTEGDRGAFLCMASGAAYKVGVYEKNASLWWKKRVFDHLVRNSDWKAHTVEKMLDIPRSVGIPVTDKRLEIFFSRDDQDRIETLLREEGIGPADPIVHIHPTSRWLFKCWRDEGMAWLIDRLQETGRVRAVLTSGNSDREIEKIDSILRSCRTRPINLSGKTTLKQLAALSRRSLFFIGVDTAPMHIAAAAGTPVIALFGPSGEFNWGPWGRDHVVIKRDMDCRPCGKDGCQGSKRSRCLEEIPEEEVVREALVFLEKYSSTGFKGENR
jgi:heptosyltransferase III